MSGESLYCPAWRQIRRADSAACRGGLFSTFDCAVKGYRQKEDPYNAIIAGFMTGGTLAVRSGPRGMFAGAVGCGILLGVFEGVGILISRMFAGQQKPMPVMMPEQQGGQSGGLVGA